MEAVDPVRRVERLSWRDGTFTAGSREVPEEMPVAISFNRTSHAVMMATPSDLEDFARGFSLSEEIVGAVGESEQIETVLLRAEPDAVPRGIELRLWVGEAAMRTLDSRRRHVAGLTGCGLCGLESLEAALRPFVADGTVLRLSRHDTNPAGNLPIPAAFHG